MRCRYCRAVLTWHPVRRRLVHKGGHLHAGTCRGCGWEGPYDHSKPLCRRCGGVVFDGHVAEPEREG